MHDRLIFCLIVFGFIFSVTANAVDCPWVHKTGNDLLNFNFYPDKVVNLTQAQVEEDLSCLKIVLSQYYSYHITYPDNEITNRVEKAISSAKAMSSAEFVELIFSFHSGYVDLHLSYKGAGVYKHFETKNPTVVKLTEDLGEEQIIERPKYTYFKPGKLMPELSRAQSGFIDYVTKNDRPLVIDLRGNRGGENTFTFSLANVLYTKDQHIPENTITQISGGLPYIGLCVTASIVYGDSVKDFCNQIKQLFGNLPFNQLLSKKLEVERRNFAGLRPAHYVSPIFLITDSLCASACEGFVEKISAHPNAQTIGTHTDGAIHFGNAISLVLPNSGIGISVPSRAENYENQAVEGVGYAPDIESNYIDLNTLFENR